MVRKDSTSRSAHNPLYLGKQSTPLSPLQQHQQLQQQLIYHHQHQHLYQATSSSRATPQVFILYPDTPRRRSLSQPPPPAQEQQQAQHPQPRPRQYPRPPPLPLPSPPPLPLPSPPQSQACSSMVTTKGLGAPLSPISPTNVPQIHHHAHPTFGGGVRRQSASAASQRRDIEARQIQNRSQSHDHILNTPNTSKLEIKSHGYGLDGMKSAPATPTSHAGVPTWPSPRHGNSPDASSLRTPTTATGPGWPALGSPTSTYSASDKLSLLGTPIPSPSLLLSFERTQDVDPEHYYENHQDQESLQKQALRFQQKLQQKPPRKDDEGSSGEDEDSDTGSVISYRRSIQRLSVSYSGNRKGRTGVPNISLFAPHQRSHLQTVSEQDHPSPSFGFNNSITKPALALNDQRINDSARCQPPPLSLQRQGDGFANVPANRDLLSQQGHLGSRPKVGRANTAGNADTTSSNLTGARGFSIPERSTSADNLFLHQTNSNEHVYHQNLCSSYLSSSSHGDNASARGQFTLDNPMQIRNGHDNGPMFQFPMTPTHPVNNNINNGSNGSNSKLGPSQQLPANSLPAPPRPSHESSRSQFSQSSRSRPEQRNLASPSHHGYRSKSLGRQVGPAPSSQAPPRQPGYSHHPMPAIHPTMSGASNGGGGAFKMHPAHHFASGGYVRPEEAMGPSNPMPEKAEDYVRQGIEFHELGDITKATNYFRIAAEWGDPVGMLMYGLSVRHGWGCKANRVLAFQYLQKSAEHAVGDLKSRDSFASKAAKGELVLAIYELGICFRHGWGVQKNKKTAAYYFEIAANLGDPDAQNDLAWCYFHGVGLKKDMHKSAKYYRLAAAQGLETFGNSWIWKEKYGGPSSPTSQDKPTPSLHQTVQS